MVCNELNRFYIPLELTCCLFGAYCHEFLNRESYDRFVVPLERELNHWKELREFVLFIELFVITKMEILQNTFERITRH